MRLIKVAGASSPAEISPAAAAAAVKVGAVAAIAAVEVGAAAGRRKNASSCPCGLAASVRTSLLGANNLCLGVVKTEEETKEEETKKQKKKMKKQKMKKRRRK